MTSQLGEMLVTGKRAGHQPTPWGILLVFLPYPEPLSVTRAAKPEISSRYHKEVGVGLQAERQLWTGRLMEIASCTYNWGKGKWGERDYACRWHARRKWSGKGGSLNSWSCACGCQNFTNHSAQGLVNQLQFIIQKVCYPTAYSTTLFCEIFRKYLYFICINYAT